MSKYVMNAKKLHGIPINVDLVESRGIKNVRTLKPLLGGVPSGIVVHNTGNSAKSADDNSHARYIQGVENADNTYVSWHGTVDHDSFTQHIPFNEVAYHAGNTDANNRYLGIEICENYKYAQAEDNGITIIAYLMHKYNIGISKVMPHRAVANNKKLCPHLILKSEKTWGLNWKKFQDRIMERYNELYVKKQKISKPKKPSAKNPITTGIKVKITGKKYATGEIIPSFARAATYTISAVHPDRVLLREISSWVHKKDIRIVK